MGIYRDSASSNPPPYNHHPGIERWNSNASGTGQRGTYLGSPSEEKENGGLIDGKRPPLSREGSRAGEDVDESGKPVENWKRAAEVTSQLKARIEQMKVRCLALHLLNFPQKS